MSTISICGNIVTSNTRLAGYGKRGLGLASGVHLTENNNNNKAGQCLHIATLIMSGRMDSYNMF